MTDRYLLCRPRGGLNDSLCQIEICWRYADRYGRILVVDTGTTSPPGLCYPFGQCFLPGIPSPLVDLNPSRGRMAQLNCLPTFPCALQGRLNDYKPVFDATLSNFKDAESNTRLTFDFNRDYDEAILVHDQCGGASIGWECLARLTMTTAFRSHVLDRFGHLIGQGYLAAGVRHTDYQSNYKQFFEGIYPDVIGRKLVVCSDSVEVLNFATWFFTQAEVIVLPGAVDTRGLSHARFACQMPAESRYTMMINAVSDLFALALAERLFIAPLAKGVGGYLGLQGFSGFHVLAHHLASRRQIVSQLLAGAA